MLVKVEDLAKSYNFSMVAMVIFMDRYEFTPFVKRQRLHTKGRPTLMFDLVPESERLLENFLKSRRKQVNK